MKIALVTNLNGIGLQRDAELLTKFLTECGHEVVSLQYDLSPDLACFSEKYDLAIFLEVVSRNLMGLAERRWAFLNPDWAKPDLVQLVGRSFEKVFAKTREAERIFNEQFPGRVHYTGFLARDQYDPAIERKPWFLHVGGNSSLRGTQTVVDAWKWKKYGKALGARLYVVSSAVSVPLLDNIFWYKRLPEDDLKKLQNMCLFHLYPSGTEGFGHAFHEALSVGAIVLTTDAPPMNEAEWAITIPSCGKTKYNLADVYEVSALDLYDKVEEMIENSHGKYDAYVASSWARQEFLGGNENFRVLFEPHLQKVKKTAVVLTHQKRPERSIAFLGNFEAPESTENQIKWALTERLGYYVEMLQENRVNLQAIEEAMRFNDAFLWVRTPNWLQVKPTDLYKFLEELKARKIPTVSMHLDKYWGIPEREAEIGNAPFWKTEFVWTADGSRQGDFFDRGVHHYWLRPAVSEVYCHPGTPREQYACDVLFVGAKHYHKEYPFRPRLIDFLEDRYGERFHHVTNVRGHELNDVYASAKVVVGDCIFAGTPFYWSDRVPETVGRYGFLIHPQVEGLDTPYASYPPQDLQHLGMAIDHWAEYERPIRAALVTEAAKHVFVHDTWTVRMRAILNRAGLS